MKISYALLLCVSTVINAESRVLPPVIDNSSYPGGSAYNTTAPSNKNAMYEVLGRVEQLQQEIQVLRGVVEEQSQTITDLKKRQDNIYSDLDQRLQVLSGGLNQNNLNQSGNENNDPNGLAIDNNQIDNVTVDGNENPKNQTPVAENVSNDDVNTEIPVKNEKELYLSAYELLRNGHNTRAIMAFRSFLVDFPNGEYSDNSQYWLGEAYKVNQDLNASKDAFSKVISGFPTSSKVPDALLKLGYLEFEQNNIAKARDYLTRVTVSHPGTTAAHLAKKKLMQMDAQ